MIWYLIIIICCPLRAIWSYQVPIYMATIVAAPFLWDCSFYSPRWHRIMRFHSISVILKLLKCLCVCVKTNWQFLALDHTLDMRLLGAGHILVVSTVCTFGPRVHHPNAVRKLALRWEPSDVGSFWHVESKVPNLSLTCGLSITLQVSKQHWLAINEPLPWRVPIMLTPD